MKIDPTELQRKLSLEQLKHKELELVREMSDTVTVREMKKMRKMGLEIVKEVAGETGMLWKVEMVKRLVKEMEMVREKVGELEMGMMRGIMSEIGFVNRMKEAKGLTRARTWVMRRVVRGMDREMENEMKRELGVQMDRESETPTATETDEGTRSRVVETVNVDSGNLRIDVQTGNGEGGRNVETGIQEVERDAVTENSNRGIDDVETRALEGDWDPGTDNGKKSAEANEDAEHLIIRSMDWWNFSVWVFSHLYSFVAAQLKKDLVEPAIGVTVNDGGKSKTIRKVKLQAYFSPLSSDETLPVVPEPSEHPYPSWSSLLGISPTSSISYGITPSSSMPPDVMASSSTPPVTVASSSSALEITEMSASSSTSQKTAPSSSSSWRIGSSASLPDTSTPMYQYRVFATASNDTFISSLYGEAFFGHCTRDAALEFCKLKEILDDDTFIVKSKPWEPGGNIFACEKLETVVRAILDEGQKLNAAKVVGPIYV